MSNRTFGHAIKDARKRQNISQKDLAKLMTEKTGQKFDQRKISYIENGELKRPLSDTVISALAHLLSLSEEDCRLAYSPDSQEVSLDSWLYVRGHGYILANAKQSKALKFHLGKYFCIFHSTESSSQKIQRGILELNKQSNGQCSAEFLLLKPDNTPIKQYSGLFFINTYFDTCYCILCGNSWQEINMLIMPWFKPTSSDNQYMMALVLTTSAGTNKRPTAHRMLISRKELRGQALELATSQLQLNTDSIYIKEDQLNCLETAVKEQQQQHPDSKHLDLALKFCQIIRQEGERFTMYRIDESRLLEVESICKDVQQRALATALIRTYSDGFYHNKIGKSGQEIFKSILEWEPD